MWKVGLMISAYLVENRHIAVKRCRHGLFMFNRNDAFVGRGLDLYGEWCEFEIQLLRQFINPGDTVIDVGANIGTHAIAFGNLVGPAGTVHAFEPQRRLFAMLAGNVALNALEHVICHHAAVGEAMGKIQLPSLPPPDTYTNYSSFSLMRDNNAGETVPLVTLDSLELSRCSVIKVDVESMETPVLRGARHLIERCQPILYVENNDQEGSKRIASVLAKLNYLAYWSIRPHYDPNNYYCNTINIWPTSVWAANLICVPKNLDYNAYGAEPFLGENDDWKACILRAQEKIKAR
jgi:FkbM family methyltransferase